MLLCRILPAGYTAPLTQVSGDVFPDGGRGRAPASPDLLRPSAASGAGAAAAPAGRKLPKEARAARSLEKANKRGCSSNSPARIDDYSFTC